MRDPEIDAHLEPLNQAIDKLRRLQMDPHPDLSAWRFMVENRLKEIKTEVDKLLSK